MGPKVIKALDSIIAAFEEYKEALEAEASKSGGGADDEAPGRVSRSGGKAKASEVPAAGKKSRKPAESDDDDVDGVSDDGDEGEDEDEVPPPKAKAKGKPTKGKPAKDDDEGEDEDEAPPPKAKAKGKATINDVKAKLTAVIKSEDLGRPRALKILKKFGVEASADLEESDYAGVIKACDAALAEVEDD